MLIAPLCPISYAFPIAFWSFQSLLHHVYAHLQKETCPSHLTHLSNVCVSLSLLHTTPIAVTLSKFHICYVFLSDKKGTFRRRI